MGIGEPLLHKDIVKMIEYAVSKNVANVIEMLTNASLLTHKISDKLISAGLSRLVVSLQGTTKDKYQKVSGVNIDFEKFIENLRYFFNNKGVVQMYIKIIDCALDDENDEQRFYKIFGDICDTIAIEHTVPIHSGVDYKKTLEGRCMASTQFGLSVSDFKVCPQPFFTMQINPDGKIVPCYSFEYPGIMGNCNNQTAQEIWNGKKFQNFRKKMLVDGIKGASKNCAKCCISKYRQFPEDILDNDIEQLKKIYK